MHSSRRSTCFFPTVYLQKKSVQKTKVISNSLFYIVFSTISRFFWVNMSRNNTDVTVLVLNLIVAYDNIMTTISTIYYHHQHHHNHYQNHSTITISINDTITRLTTLPSLLQSSALFSPFSVPPLLPKLIRA